ncbi:hypothetical protein D1AOALGA4SA_2818 [Olavius algarvensis Delta 1 endosymbiont]|nr:hypothetical protein D1AOALGA4SA_2818 [Olavius algarvensis Delta 1 endosymbiont]
MATTVDIAGSFVSRVFIMFKERWCLKDLILIPAKKMI